MPQSFPGCGEEIPPFHFPFFSEVGPSRRCFLRGVVGSGECSALVCPVEIGRIYVLFLSLGPLG